MFHSISEYSMHDPSVMAISKTSANPELRPTWAIPSWLMETRFPEHCSFWKGYFRIRAPAGAAPFR
jgi:hypothetical protein